MPQTVPGDDDPADIVQQTAIMSTGKRVHSGGWLRRGSRGFLFV